MRIAIIPARGGSKRIPQKNIISFCGKPMLEHVLSELVATQIFDEIHVSTDDEKIAQIAKNGGASVPFLRHSDLATDFTPVLPVVKWVVAQYEAMGKAIDSVMMVMPCAPLLESEDFMAAVKAFENSDQKMPLLSMARFPSPIEWAFRERGGIMQAINPGNLAKRSQDLLTAYYDCGLFAIFSRQYLLRTETVATEFIKFEIPRWKAIDIDEPEDLELAKKMMAFKKNQLT